VLVVQGEQDTVVNPSQTHRLVEKLPSSHTHYEEITGKHQLLSSGSASLERVTALITSRLNPHMPEDRHTY
jgi:alpha-beta hydrolase superfamily lysophospholipase